MVREKLPGGRRPSTTGSATQRPQRGWERVTVKHPEHTAARATFRIDAPSPSDEVLAKHDADLDEPATDEDPSDRIVF